MWFIGVEVEQETSAPPPKKNPGSAPVIVLGHRHRARILYWILVKTVCSHYSEQGAPYADTAPGHQVWTQP